MRINSITLHNFKSFEGTCYINGLTNGLDQNRTIILFGGLNGVGKTSIFEAILLCLYGKDNKTLFPSKGARREDYYSYVASVTNENAKSKHYRTEMWIKLDFDQVEIGNTAQTLSIMRKWIVEPNQKAAREIAFEITQDNKPIEIVGQDEFEEFVRNELIPHEVTQFFFFDGEKIQDFIKDEDKAFAESLEAVLGITLYKTLSRDMGEIRQRLVRDYNKDKNVQGQLRIVDGNIATVEARITECQDSIETLKEEIDSIEDRVQEIEKETHRITRVNAENRQEAEAERMRLTEEKATLEEQIFNAIQDSLPFVMMQGLSQKLTDQLAVEQELMRSMAARTAAESRIAVITQRLFEDPASEPPLTSEQKSFYQHRLKLILGETFGSQSNQGIMMIHNLSDRDIDNIRHRIASTEGIVGNLAVSLGRLQEVEPKLKQIIQAEQRFVDDETRMLYEERGSLLEQIKVKQQEIESYEVEIDRKNGELTSLKTQRTNLEDKVVRTNKMHDQLEYCQKIRRVLEEFSHRLRARKVELLQQHTLEMWGQLARKQDQVKRISIDPDRNFSIDLFDDDDRIIDKTKLSAGEKELLAISLIWGLTRLTNRSLPIVIDTPLGRLDSEHRAHIAERYFPRASHQVILLSTDTELIGEEYSAVAPYIAKRYLIEKDSAQETSRVREGYFITNGN